MISSFREYTPHTTVLYTHKSWTKLLFLPSLEAPTAWWKIKRTTIGIIRVDGFKSISFHAISIGMHFITRNAEHTGFRVSEICINWNWNSQCNSKCIFMHPHSPAHIEWYDVFIANTKHFWFWFMNANKSCVYVKIRQHKVYIVYHFWMNSFSSIVVSTNLTVLSDIL